MKKNILVSACLLGIACRYDGNRVKKTDIEKLKEKYNIIPICPEIFGGLPTPRVPSERIGERVVMKDGKDVTENYRRGAEESLRLADMLGAKIALLKSRSPSCGKGKIYDGTYSGTLTDGNGVTADIFLSNDISVYTEEEFELLLSAE